MPEPMPAPTLEPQLASEVSALLAPLLKPLAKALLFVADPASPLYWVYVASTLMFAYLGWSRFERRHGEGFRAFRARHFGAALWGHASARVDYRYYVVNMLVFSLAIVPLLLSSAWLSDLLHNALAYWFGTGPGWTAGIGAKLALTLLFFVAYDFGRWLAHTLLHDMPLLWEFHKVHHSAEVLTPFTAFRVHPLDLFITLSVPALTTAPVLGLFAWLYPQALTAYSFLGVNLVIGLSGLIANLKHWQVWFRYGPLDGWWISPAHHQIHHSADPRHWGRNRGFELGCWDRWYGSLHIPARENEVAQYGLGDGSDGEWHSLRRLYLRPFAAALRRLAPRPRGGAPAVLALLLLLPLPRAHAADTPATPATIEIDTLTWPELATAIAAGSTTVLVPVGGTEQNGPGMAYAKHNAIVRAAAAEIARRAGRVLVAPVLPFAPEGTFAPRSGNLQWPGTIGLREATLAAVLEDEVASLALAGFRRIVFLGDHGGSQRVQADVAQKLSRTLASRGVLVQTLDRYYEPAPLKERLERLGIDPALAGDHAGLVDTAELLAVAPALVHRERLDPSTWTALAAAPGPGGSGQPQRATPELGHALLEQRIAAAVAQLAALPAAAPPD